MFSAVANIASAKKRIRTNEKARLRNKSVRSEVKTETRRVHEAIAAGDPDEIREAARKAQVAISTAGRKGVFHKNTAARKQAKLARVVNQALSD